MDQSTFALNAELEKTLALVKTKHEEITEELKRLKAAKMAKLQTAAILGALILVDLVIISRLI